jgi:hypothetical protein
MQSILTDICQKAMKNPTNPDSATDSSASSAPLDSTLLPSNSGLQGGLQMQQSSLQPTGGSLAGSVTPGGIGAFGDSNYEVFDPLNWMLDGLVDFPYSYAAVQGLEAQGMN